MSLLLKLSLRELEPWFILWSFFFLNLFFFKKSTKLHGVSWTSWRNRHVGSQSYIYLLFLLNTCLIIKIWLVFLIVMAGPLFFLIGYVILLLPFRNLIRMSMPTVSFHMQLKFEILRSCEVASVSPNIQPIVLQLITLQSWVKYFHLLSNSPQILYHQNVLLWYII